ncbi:hypothetical protein GUJ51_13150 [Enterococcus durans]|nr:hypothetical protein [Enterococcus durans]
MIRDYQAIGCTWFLRGHQRKIPTYGQHKGVKLIGTLDYETGRIICTEEGAYDAAAFLRFLERGLGGIFGLRHHSDADAPRVMLAAHMDEVGFMLTQITERGLFSFSAATSEKSPLTDNTKG